MGGLALAAGLARGGSATVNPQQLHQLLEAAALLVGSRYYLLLRRRSGQGGALEPGSFAVLVGCLAGAATGNKLMFWLQVPDQLIQHLHEPLPLIFGGQSIVGGLLGGLIGVEIAKKVVGLRRSTGDLFVFPILLGIVIGRLGCYFAGVQDDTWGLPTTLPWGIDPGDGVPHHPAPLYEIAFASVLWIVLAQLKPRLADRPGLLFKLMLASYLLWRLLTDSLKAVPFAYPGGLSGIQTACLLALLVYAPMTWHQWGRSPRGIGVKA